MMARTTAACSALALAALGARDGAAHGLALEVSWTSTLVLDAADGTLFGWGTATDVLGESESRYGGAIGDEPSEMGSGLPRIRSGKLANVTAIARRAHCLMDGSAPPSRALHCWGYCSRGRCGHGARGHVVRIEDAPLTDLGSDAADRVVSAQGSPLGDTRCALFASGRVKCWGFNEVGQLGLGDTEDRGDDPGEMGDGLPFVDLGTGVRAVQVAVGSYIACAVLEGRRLIKCWGWNEHGELGLGDNETRGDEPGEMGDELPALDMGDEVEDVQFGRFFGCALFAKTREVKCWGHNYKGSLGAPHEDDVVLADATLSAVSVGGRVAKLAVAEYHVCVILEDEAATVKCWGMNNNGQLGLGSDRSDTSGWVPSDWPDVAYGVPGETAVEVRAATVHTCVLLADGQVRCWGNNGDGQLGHGTRYFRWGRWPHHMGANLPTSFRPPTLAAKIVRAGIGVGVGMAVTLAAVAYFRRNRPDRAAAADADAA